MFRNQLLAIVTIIALILFNRWLFAALFGTDYVLWYIENGTFISFGITFISFVSKNFNKDVNTVSANPLTYLTTYLLYLAIPIGLLGTLMRANAGVSEMAEDSGSSIAESGEADNEQAMPASNAGSSLDSLLFLLWAPIILLAPFLWIVVVIPLQYFVFLICGAPARYIHPKDYRAIVGVENGKVALNYLKSSAEITEGSQDVSLGIEPFPLTNLLSILFFETVKIFLGS